MNKYRNKITEVDGIKFRSKKEAKRYGDLKLLKMAGDVLSFKMQVPFIVSGKIKYYADFVVAWSSGNITVEDTKGFRTPLYKLKKSLMKEKYEIDIVEI